MNNPGDFSLPHDLGHAPPHPEPAESAPATPQAPAPMIVVEYRQAGLLQRLTPPLLILATAVAILWFQRQTPPRWDLSHANGPVTSAPAPETKGRPAPPTGPSAPATPAAAAASPETPPNAGSPTLHAPLPELPIVLAPQDPDAKTASESWPVAGSNVAAAVNASPFELGPDTGLEPLPVAPAAPRSAEPEAEPVFSPIASGGPMPTTGDPPLLAADGSQGVVGVPAIPTEGDTNKEEILDDIRREADLKQAEQKEMAEMKPKARALLLAENVARIQSIRLPFRGELRVLLKAPGPNISAEIEDLCNRSVGVDIAQIVSFDGLSGAEKNAADLAVCDGTNEIPRSFSELSKAENWEIWKIRFYSLRKVRPAAIEVLASIATGRLLEEGCSPLREENNSIWAGIADFFSSLSCPLDDLNCLCPKTPLAVNAALWANHAEKAVIVIRLVVLQREKQFCIRMRLIEVQVLESDPTLFGGTKPTIQAK